MFRPVIGAGCYFLRNVLAYNDIYVLCKVCELNHAICMVSLAKKLEKIPKQEELSPNLTETGGKSQNPKDHPDCEGAINTYCSC